jgi:amino acid adenylation domain-containing protein
MPERWAAAGRDLVDRENGRSLRSGFLRSASSQPQAPCFVIKDRTFSYGEVEEAARCWASAIVEALGRPAARVGVFGSRSFESYVGVLAALCSGATFVPLNPAFPADRTREMIAQAELDAIIADPRAAQQLDGVVAGIAPVPVLLLPGTDPAPGRSGALFAPDLAVRTPLAALPPILPGDIAYLLFTSGSTGKPKGVPVTHANALAFLDFAAEQYAVTSSDRFSQTFDQTFDLSIFDLFLPWQCGASFFSLQPLDLIAPARFITRNDLTIWFSVPSIPALMRKKGTLRPAMLPSLRLSLFCGEPLPVETAHAWQAAAPASIVENLYGPTELTIACFRHRWDGERSAAMALNGIVPIGRPFPGLGAVTIGEAAAAAAEEGELYVCGPQTAPGYWRDPERTAERFVELKGHASPAMRFYQTGDRVKRLENGDYAYLGRADQQIKVLGHRVELGEVEACLRMAPQVVDAVALGWPVRDGTAAGIIAFVSGTGLDPGLTMRQAEALLPDYMVPKEIFMVDAMPLNANGKIDRNALLARLG